MKRITALALFLILCFAISSLIIVNAEPSWAMWSKAFGGMDDEGLVHDVYLVKTSNGGYALFGNTYSFGAGEYDFWLIKTNEQGIPEFLSWIILPLFLICHVIFYDY